jgi:hypothetical protein
MVETKVPCQHPSAEGKSGLTGRMAAEEPLSWARRALILEVTNGLNRAKGIIFREMVGGRDRDRTCDLMLAKHALSQLSYTPILAIELV